MKHKKLRTVLITLVVIAALVAAYMIAFMRPQPLLDCLGGTEAPTTGTLTVYDQAHQEGQKWDVAEGSELDEVAGHAERPGPLFAGPRRGDAARRRGLL